MYSLRFLFLFSMTNQNEIARNFEGSDDSLALVALSLSLSLSLALARSLSFALSMRLKFARCVRARKIARRCKKETGGRASAKRAATKNGDAIYHRSALIFPI